MENIQHLLHQVAPSANDRFIERGEELQSCPESFPRR